jgi:hypothetical protein
VRESELDRVLEIPALRLEVVLGQVHAFVPDDARELPHLGVSADGCGRPDPWSLMRFEIADVIQGALL